MNQSAAIAISNLSPLAAGLRRPTAARPLVYLAEDDPDLRRLLADGLRNKFDVLSASSGRHMLRLLTAASRGELRVPDAIVMDVRMPGCSGIDVLRALRMASWDQPIVMITGFGEPKLHTLAADHGASVVLDKPFELQDLVGVLEVLLLFGDHEEAPETVRSPQDRDGRSFEAGGAKP